MSNKFYGGGAAKIKSCRKLKLRFKLKFDWTFFCLKYLKMVGTIPFILYLHEDDTHTANKHTKQNQNDPSIHQIYLPQKDAKQHVH